MKNYISYTRVHMRKHAHTGKCMTKLKKQLNDSGAFRE